MFCIWCGAQVPDDSQFCPECGSNLDPGGVSEMPPVQQPVSGSPPVPDSPPIPAPPSAPEPVQLQKPVSMPPQPSPPPDPLNQPPVWYPPQPPMPPTRGKGRGVLIGVLAAVICLLVAAVIFMVLKLFVWKDDSTPADDRKDGSFSAADQAQPPVDSQIPGNEIADDSMGGFDDDSMGFANTPQPSTPPAPTPTPTPEPSSYYIIPDSDKRYLTQADLIGLTDEELRLARNEIYARHGRLFDDAGLQDYFNQQPWYHGIIAPGDFTQSMLNDYERQNASLILEYENSR